MDAVTVIGTLGLIALAVIVGRWIDRRLRPGSLEAGKGRPQRDLHAAGESAGTALRLKRREALRLVGAMRCRRCGGELDGSETTTVRYAGRELTIFSRRCPACDERRAIYIEVM